MRTKFKTLLWPVATAAMLFSAVAFSKEDPVLLKINGEEFNRSDLEIIHKNLQDPWRQYEFDSILPMLQDLAIEMSLSEKYAMNQKIDQTEEYKERLKVVEKNILRAMASEKFVNERLTDERVKEIYDEQIQMIEPQEERKLSHILLETQENAKEIIKRLDKGEKFADLAKTESIGPSGPMGGDLGWATKDSFIPEFAEAAWKIKKGKYGAEPVESSFGYHVIWVEDAREREIPKFEDIKELLKLELAQSLEGEFIDLILKDAQIERYDITGKNLVEENMSDSAGSDGYVEESEALKE